MDGTTTLNDFDFPVELVPLSCLTKDGHNINVPENMSRALIRPDTHDVLGVHGSKYRITTHSQVVDTVEEAVVKANLSSDRTMNVDVYENGALLKGTISFNDITIEPVVGDYIRFDINFWNSYNGQWSIQISGDGRRLFCMNGCTTPHSVARTFRKHSSNINTEQEATKLARSLDIFFNQKDVWSQWANCSVFLDDVEYFFKEELCQYPSNSSWERYNMKQLDALMKQYHEERQTLGNTAWAAYNAMTHWASHPDASKPYNVERTRSNAVAKALRSNTWNTKVLCL